jgi:hypothetical protein
VVLGVTQLVVHHVQVEVHLPGVLGPELAHLEVEHHPAAQLLVAEEQVEEELLVADD